MEILQYTYSKEEQKNVNLKGLLLIYWSCLGCDASAKSRFGITPGEYEWTDPHEPGCPAQQQEAPHGAPHR